MRNRILSVIEQEVKACRLCRLAENRINAVAGEGLHNALIMFIGEAPGASEDLAGRPFVGHAGKILDQALAYARLRREQVFITNVVKCRPPSNRKPRKDEVLACINYLYRQIDAVRPGVICLLGRTAHDALLGGRFREHIGRVVIKKIGYARYPCLTTYHPAAVIYNPRLRNILVKDIKNLTGLISSLDSNYTLTSLQLWQWQHLYP